jgi:ABC-type bacteriocin/lantibiotic exporter with double-glycine peptidase domain
MCGPASLKILLSYYEREHSEAQLAKLCETTPDFGTTHAQMMAGAQALGAEIFAKDQATINDIRGFVEEETPVIVGWWSDDESHYSVVYEVGKFKIFMMDPDTESGIHIMPIEEFESVWHDTEGVSKEPITHWMMAIKKI